MASAARYSSSPVPSSNVTSRSLDFLPEREVVSAVHREGEHRRLVSEDGRGAVALVDVAVDDGNARDCAFAQEDGGATATSLKTQ